jgi:hypothetical protein
MRIIQATECNAVMGQAENGLVSVVLVRWNDTEHEWTTHGAYQTRDDAWYVATLMVTFLTNIVKTHGSFTDDDVSLVHRRAEHALWTGGAGIASRP